MTTRTGLRQLEPAATLDDVYKTMSPEPLMTPLEIQAFYQGDLNRVRGGDKVGAMALGLERCRGTAFYKALLMGHPGVGKSTELTRLVEQMNGRFRAIRFQVTRELNPGCFKPFDVLLLMMIRVVEETSKPVSEGGAGAGPSEELLREVEAWFDDEKIKLTNSSGAGIEGSAGIGPPANTLWLKVIGMFANIKGEIKYAANRTKEVIEYRLARVEPD